MHVHLTNMGPFINNCMQYFSGKRILEIGTGSGILSIYFSQMGYDVTGLDRDRGIMERNARLNRMLEGKARFVQGDMLHLPFCADAFDACYHQGLLEHFDPPQIQQALRLQVKIAPRVIFSVPTNRWRHGTFGDERLWPGGYWRRMLGEFQVLDIFGMSYQSFVARSVNALGCRVTGCRPGWLYRRLALAQAGEIGFVVAKR
jgi:SAM-dependent methyltransferase